MLNDCFDSDLDALRIRLRDLRVRFYAGEAVEAEMNDVAAQCAAIVNTNGAAVAKRLGVKHRPVSARQLMRSDRFLNGQTARH